MSISGVDIQFELEGRPLHFRLRQEHLDPNIMECNSDKKRGYLLTATPHAGMKLPPTLKVFVDGEQLSTTYHGCWEWKPLQGFAGLSHLSVALDEQTQLETTIRVFPEKVSQERYEQMLLDISSIATDLLFKLNSSINEHALLQQKEQVSSALREYTLLRDLIEDFEEVMFHICRQPYQALKSSYEHQAVSHIQQGEGIPLAGAVREVTLFSTTQYLPEIWQVCKNTLTYDVYENQFLKHFIQQQLFFKANFILSKVANEIHIKENRLTIARAKNWGEGTTLMQEMVRLKEVERSCQMMIQQCNAWGGETFLKRVKQPAFVGKATQVLLKHQQYSRFFQLYLRFQEELRIGLDTSNYITDLSMQKVCDIYEIWSVFTVTSLLIDQFKKAGYTIDKHNFFFEVQKDTFHFTVAKNTPGVVLSKGNTRIEIKYEPIYQNMSGASIHPQEVLGVSPHESYSQLTPDMAIEVYERGLPRDVIILDVKYRWKKKGDDYIPAHTDKDKMLRYYNYIWRKTKDQQGHLSFDRVVSCVYIIYPGNQLQQSIHNPVGALPLIPTMSASKKREIERALETLLRNARLV